MIPKVEFVEQFLRAAVPEIKDDWQQVNRVTWGNLSPERRLLVAVLEDACEKIRGVPMPGISGTSRIQGEPRREALRWMHSDRVDYLCAFLSICEYLELDPEAVRKAVVGKRRAA